MQLCSPLKTLDMNLQASANSDYSHLPLPEYPFHVSVVVVQDALLLSLCVEYCRCYHQQQKRPHAPTHLHLLVGKDRQ